MTRSADIANAIDFKPAGPEPPPPPPDPLAAVREQLRPCIQCGTCTGSCPNAFAMDITPRKMWRMVIMGMTDPVFESRTFALCSSCYYCTLRCPRGLPLTDAMAELKRIGAKLRPDLHKSGARFYQSFMESVRRHGRVHESEFMGLYFFSMKNPALPFRFASLGMKLMRKGKVRPEWPFGGGGELDAVFRKAAELEEDA